MAISDMNEASGHEHGTDKNDTHENDVLENVQKSVVKEVPVSGGEKGMWLKLTKILQRHLMAMIHLSTSNGKYLIN